MRYFMPKIIAVASVFAAIPLSSAYAVHRHHRVDTMTTASVPADPKAKAALDQLLNVRQGIREARQAGKITQDQARDLMQQADTIQRTALTSGDRSALGEINALDQRLQNATGQGTYMGDGADGGYYPNG
ncbi:MULTISPECIES: hypothetical protein [unclassified Mesorhizobium]|uniref:hypothetical protein n=1 Tax=unclassified Mesorhizobium TaxID=325217 RepID=UPI000FCB977B|nr:MULTISPECIES: hypothetical protein [unclassified Mesorhizobium]RUW19650.1 hypothetical protein EOA38_34270 [Mesorhizobium sp. M1E.F.Ca.ET.041.01.1.1]RWD88382.1 MAG: hypothetical protein EOS38_14865 [Mesorhizobium sp.]RWD94323.1 MAG: hypothetical protein EOS39_07595 [Mesorhizobium sp.]TIV53127.1 MAG: hypothetical protein E5V88_10120 [Mesorhizobium sp.]